MAVTEAQVASANLVWGDRAGGDRAPASFVGQQSYAFELDDDLTKVINIQATSTGLEIEVRYGRDYLLQQDRYSIPLERAPSIAETELGVTVKVTRRVLPWLAWPRWQLTYRF